jgi:hypothetical protein
MRRGVPHKATTHIACISIDFRSCLFVPVLDAGVKDWGGLPGACTMSSYGLGSKFTSRSGQLWQPLLGNRYL